MEKNKNKTGIFLNGNFYSVFSIKSFTSVENDLIIYLKNGNTERIRFDRKADTEKCLEILGEMFIVSNLSNEIFS